MIYSKESYIQRVGESLHSEGSLFLWGHSRDFKL